MKQFEQFLHIFSFDSRDQIQELQAVAETQKNYAMEMESAVGKFLAKIENVSPRTAQKVEPEKKVRTANQTISFRPERQGSLFLSGLINIMREMRELQHVILQS